MTVILLLDPVLPARQLFTIETMASKLQRTAAPHFDFQVKTFVGGKYELANLDALWTGQAYDPTNETTLTGDVEPNDATIPVSATTGFDKGTFIIEPASSTEQHELIAYTSTNATNFLGCTRGDMVMEESGYHTSGDKVYEWYPITDRVGQINLGYDMDDSVATWSATIRGWNFNSRLLDNDNSIITMVRFRPKNDDLAVWTTWEVWFVGYITDAKLSDRHTQAREWTATVAPISAYVNATDVPALHFGRENLAANKTVTVSSYLKDPYLAVNTGEYAGYPNLDGPQAVDEDINTLWMSQGLPETAEIGHDPSGFSINEVYLRPQPGYRQQDYQWIEIAYKGSGTGYFGNCNIGWRTTGGYGSVFTNAYGNRVLSTNYLKPGVLSNFKMDDDGSFIILCNNVARFKEMFGGAGATYIIEWWRIAVGDFWLDPDAGMLCLFNKRMGLGYLESVVWWRSGAKPFGLHDFQGDGDNPGTAHSGWTGLMIPSDTLNLPRGTSFTRRPDGRDPIPSSADSRSNWHYPNYDPTPGQRQKWGYEFISVDLGEMNIKLTSELSSGETTEAIMDSSLGLNQNGVVQINAEILRYSDVHDTDNKLQTLERGLFGTTAATHPVDSIVKQWEDGTAYNLYKIDGLTMIRRRNLDDNGDPIVAKHFDVFFTDYTNPVMPDDHLWDNGYHRGGWQAYWKKVYTTASNTSPVKMINLAEGHRTRHVCIIVYEMSDAGRVCVNELKIYPHIGYEVIGGPAPIGPPGVRRERTHWTGILIRNILSDHFGLYPGHFILTDLGLAVDELPTTKGAAGNTIKDICQRTGCMLLYMLDGRIEHRFDPTFPTGKWSDRDIVWDRTYARSVKPDRPWRHNVSQVVLRASNPISDEHFEAKYPPEALDLGSELTVEDIIVSDAEDAHYMAAMHFARENGPMSLSVKPVGPADWVRPGQRHGLDWVLDEDGVLLSGENFIVTSVEWQVEFGDKDTPKTWDTSIRLTELRG